MHDLHAFLADKIRRRRQSCQPTLHTTLRKLVPSKAADLDSVPDFLLEISSDLLQAKSAAGDAQSAAGDVSGSAKSASGDVAQNAKSAVGDAKGAAQSAGRQVDQATPDLSGVFDDIVGKVGSVISGISTVISAH